MATPSITIDGITLNDTFLVSNIRRPFPPARLDTQDVAGRDGTLVVGQTLGPREVSFRLWRPTSDHATMLAEFASVVEMLSDGEHVLSIGDERGRTRNVRLSGDLDFDEYEATGSVAVTLVQPDPFCQLPPYDVTVERGRVSTVTLSHANPWLTIHAPGALKSQSNSRWGLIINGEYPMYVKLLNSGASDVLIEYKGVYRRRVKVNGELSTLTLDSDWPVRLPIGECTLGMIASDEMTSAATVTITERCI